MRALLAAALTFLAAAPARGAEIAVALTQTLVEVDAGFSGARLVLFGALSGVDPADLLRPANLDIVAVVKGPSTDFSIRPMQRQGIIWTRGAGAVLRGAPSILLTSATRPLDEFTTPALRRRLGLGAESVDFYPLLRISGDAISLFGGDGARRFVDAFLDAGRASGRYGEAAQAVSFRKGALFSIDVELPPTTPVGVYAVDVYLIRDAEVVSHDEASLTVSKVGVERQIYDIAHQRPIAYGIACVVIAVAAGLAGAAAFRK
ncbi:MAG: TIGR02186 family protein [Pseudomonadota bacterium]|nr:TIGR02186 family protein [Pseudomonadota bacterium]